MSKKAKNENKARRRQAKAARKKANYLRTGPKIGQEGRKMKRNRLNSFKPGKPRKEPWPLLGQKTSAGKRRAKKKERHTIGHKGNYPKFPLRPLRKRCHLGIAEMVERKSIY